MSARSGLRINAHLVIPLDEVELTFVTSGGPGGQHANRSATRVEARFDAARSESLGPRQRQRLLDRAGPVIRVSAGDERSQSRNREIALERLRNRIADALRVPKRRVATKPARAARERRLDAKRKRSGVKRMRARPSED